MKNTARCLGGTALLSLMLGLTAAGSAQAAESPAAESAGAQRPAVGDSAPAFSLSSTTGTVVDLAALRGKERAVVVFFRGSW